MINIDAGKIGFDNLVDLIVANNGGAEFAYSLTSANISFDAPQPYSGPENAAANTSVNVVALLDKGYSGAQTVTYYRPSLAEVQTVPGSTVLIPSATAGDDPVAYKALVKSTMATALGLRASDFEFVDDVLPIPASENNPVSADIVPVATSLIYAGAALTISWAATDTDIPLNQVITVTALSGFDI